MVRAGPPSTLAPGRNSRPSLPGGLGISSRNSNFKNLTNRVREGHGRHVVGIDSTLEYVVVCILLILASMHTAVLAS
jgi:hypothetical protein